MFQKKNTSSFPCLSLNCPNKKIVCYSNDFLHMNPKIYIVGIKRQIEIESSKVTYDRNRFISSNHFNFKIVNSLCFHPHLLWSICFLNLYLVLVFFFSNKTPCTLIPIFCEYILHHPLNHDEFGIINSIKTQHVFCTNEESLMVELCVHPKRSTA